MPSPRQPRLPVGPFLRAYTGSINGLGKNRAKRFYNAKRHGGMTVDFADELAVKVLGVHPISVWGQAWTDLPTG